MGKRRKNFKDMIKSKENILKRIGFGGGIIFFKKICYTFVVFEKKYPDGTVKLVITIFELTTASPTDFFTHISSRLALSNVWVFSWWGNKLRDMREKILSLKTLFEWAFFKKMLFG